MGIEAGTLAERRGSTPFDSGFGYDFGDPVARLQEAMRAREQAVIRMMGGTGMPAQLVDVETVPYGGLNEPAGNYVIRQAIDPFMLHKPA